MNSVTRNPSLGAGRFSRSIYGVCSDMAISLRGVALARCSSSTFTWFGSPSGSVGSTTPEGQSSFSPGLRRLGKAVVSPEELFADKHGRDAEYPGADRLLRLQLQPLLDRPLANLSEDMVRIEANRLRDGAEVGFRAETASI